MKVLKNKIVILYTAVLLAFTSSVMAQIININGYTRLTSFTVHLKPNIESAYRNEIKVLLPENSSYTEGGPRGIYMNASQGINLNKAGQVYMELPIKYKSNYFIITTGLGSLVTVEKLKKSENIDSLKEDAYFLIKQKKGALIAADNNSITYSLEFEDYRNYTFTRFFKVIVKDDIKFTIYADYSNFFHPVLGDITTALELATAIFEKIAIID